MSSTEREYCPCGLPLHYSSPENESRVKGLILAAGPTLLVEVDDGTGIAYKVPRHFIALHGLKAEDLPFLASLYDWEQA